MDLRLTFNEVPELYDRLRPTYVPELFSDIFDYSKIKKGLHALEIGIGTGQATKPFLDAGITVKAIELGNNLADFVKNKYKSYNNFKVINIGFEDFYTNEKFDIIYSATAFHWIPENIGYTKAFELLKSGGILAQFRNYPYKDKGNEPLHLAFVELYHKYMPKNASKKLTEYNEVLAEEKSKLSKKYGFINQKYSLYSTIRTMNAVSYADLIKTYSNHIAIGKEKLELFSQEIKNAINKYGGIINIYDTQELQIAMKP